MLEEKRLFGAGQEWGHAHADLRSLADEMGGHDMKARSIAVLDDDPAFLEVMDDLLRDEGYEVQLIAFSTTQDAYTQISVGFPDLVMLDLRVGDFNNGYDLLKMLRTDQRTARIPVILCTGDAFFLKNKQEMLTRLDAYPLEKPFDIEELLLLLRRLLD
jgi:CheY-like chemotaxis protein